MLGRELLVENQQGTREDLNNNFKDFPGTLEKFRPVGPFSNFFSIFKVTFKFLKVLQTLLPNYFHGQSERNFRRFRPVCSEFRKYLSASFLHFFTFLRLLIRSAASSHGKTSKKVAKIVKKCKKLAEKYFRNSEQTGRKRRKFLSLCP